MSKENNMISAARQAKEAADRLTAGIQAVEHKLRQLPLKFPCSLTGERIAIEFSRGTKDWHLWYSEAEKTTRSLLLDAPLETRIYATSLLPDLVSRIIDELRDRNDGLSEAIHNTEIAIGILDAELGEDS